MTVKELAIMCVDSINHPKRSAGVPLITLEGKKTLFSKGGDPRPIRLLCENARGNKVWHYNAISVLAALVAHGAVKMEDVK